MFSCVTFPFLFGVMFGDLCHGSLLFFVGCLLCQFSDDIFAKLSQRSPLMLIMHIRYLLLLMGFFATFCGLMYNDFASIPLFFKTSCYDIAKDETGKVIRPQEPEQLQGCVHTIGIDPVWYLSTQEITFLNSAKMKLAVVIGVAHMSMGVVMKGLNALYFRQAVNFVFEFIPQIVMLIGLFGYMDYIIMAKWTTDWEGREDRSPSIIATMIGMFLGGGEIPEKSDALLVSAEH